MVNPNIFRILDLYFVDEEAIHILGRHHCLGHYLADGAGRARN